MTLRVRIYVDTSVIGGCFDEEFHVASLQLMKAFDRGLKQAVISDLTIAELNEARSEVRNQLKRPGLKDAEIIFSDEETNDLAQAYIADGVVGTSSQADAQHIALATVYRVDILVSWNFKHIVQWGRIRGFNAVNFKLGYPTLEIRSPMEVIE